MANQYLYGLQGVREAGIVKLYGSFTVGSSGAITESDCKGFTVTKTGSETGRYTLTLGQKYNKLRGCSVIVEGAADAAYDDEAGLQSMLRGVDVANGVLHVQFVDAAASVDAELVSGCKVYIELSLKNTTAY